MTPPRRLLDSLDRARSRALLASWSDEAPPAGGLERTAAALGVSAAALTQVGALSAASATGALAQAGAAAAPGGAAAAQGGAAAAHSGAAAAHSGAAAVGGGAAATGGVAGAVTGGKGLLAASGFAKWLGIGFVGGALSLGGVHVAANGRLDSALDVFRTSPESTPVGTVPERGGHGVQATPARGTVQGSVPRTQGHSERAASQGDAPLPDAALGVGFGRDSAKPAEPGSPALEEFERSAAAASENRTPGLGAAPERDSVAVEIALLDQVRAALAEGRSSAALVLLARYRAAARTELLNPEATVLEVEALHAAGRVTEARALALRYVNAHGSGPQAARLRRFLDATAVRE